MKAFGFLLTLILALAAAMVLVLATSRGIRHQVDEIRAHLSRLA